MPPRKPVSVTTDPPALRLAGAELETPSPEMNADALADEQETAPGKYSEGHLIAEKYRLVRKLGEGGMGAVWVAQNEALGIKVAIKLIGANRRDEHLVGRLTQEARAAAKLGHPGIIRVFDFGETSTGDPYIVMELLHGEDLAAALTRRGSLSETKAVQTILPVVHALAAAHEKGIVHRDLKPANIFLARTDSGLLQPKLVDFGVAKFEREGFVRLTRAGALLGSPAYMSPEQARGEDVDPSADIWAVCVVLYEMVTGNIPFGGDNYNSLLWSISHDDPPPTATQFGGDPALWAIIERGLRKKRVHRWESMHELGTALAHWLFARGVHEDIAGGSLRTTWLERLLSNADALAAETAPPAAEATGRIVLGLTGPSPDAATLFEQEPRAPLPSRERAWLAVAAIAVVAAVAGGTLLAIGRSTSPAEATVPSASKGEGSARNLAGAAPAPSAAEPIGMASPTVSEPSVTPTTAASSSARAAAVQPVRPKSVAPRPTATAAKPRGKLKNPFE